MIPLLLTVTASREDTCVLRIGGVCCLLSSGEGRKGGSAVNFSRTRGDSQLWAMLGLIGPQSQAQPRAAAGEQERSGTGTCSLRALDLSLLLEVAHHM